MKRQCPICLNETRLVEHHWWEDKHHTIGHIRLICHKCNAVLRTLKGEDNHVLPSWDEQITYTRSRTNRITYQIRVRPPTKEKLDYLKACNPNKSWDELLEPLFDYYKIT